MFVLCLNCLFSKDSHIFFSFVCLFLHLPKGLVIILRNTFRGNVVLYLVFLERLWILFYLVACSIQIKSEYCYLE